MKKIISLTFFFAVISVACAKKGSGEPVTPPVTPPVTEPDPPASVADCKKCIVLSEQAQQRVAIADVPSKKIFWQWTPQSSNVQAAHYAWFNNISEAKIVYNGKYILTNASGGGVALIRIADKKTVWYAFAGGNTHSAELLPDGNIVSASSTGNYLMLFKVDTLHFPANVYTKKIPIDFGHNVVWDHKNQLLWTAAGKELKSFRYNFNCAQPDLEPVETLPLPGKEAHDLFPVYNEEALWLTNTTNVYKFMLADKKLIQADGIQANIKSVSSGPADFPVIIIRPKESWWTDEVIDAKGNGVFYEAGLKIYKARWVLPNAFSYPANNEIRQCK
ncbi:DUF6528 family protein [Longitalea luteola]|uniref:DUF6528 family protein n=1 Tax=Longitalea luteola TaxID=2812563 RepID=UPI001A97CDC9|nr:DUF6528 family protein [Longitalea luteola]